MMMITKCIVCALCSVLGHEMIRTPATVCRVKKTTIKATTYWQAVATTESGSSLTISISGVVITPDVAGISATSLNVVHPHTHTLNVGLDGVGSHFKATERHMPYEIEHSVTCHPTETKALSPCHSHAIRKSVYLSLSVYVYIGKGWKAELTRSYIPDRITLKPHSASAGAPILAAVVRPNFTKQTTVQSMRSECGWSTIPRTLQQCGILYKQNLNLRKCALQNSCACTQVRAAND